MSLFGSLDLSQVQEVPTDDTHTFVWYSHTVAVASWDDRKYLNITYSLADDALDYKYKKRLWLPTLEDFEQNAAEATKAVNKYREWMRNHGVSEDELDNPDFDSLTGMEVEMYGKTSTGNDGKKYWNAFSVKRV